MRKKMQEACAPIIFKDDLTVTGHKVANAAEDLRSNMLL
jgi:hypothetical protein